MPCMFCGTDTDLTIEHVFPAFMGGELEVPVGSCSRHNGEIAVWEGKIKKDTALLLHLLLVENRYGIVPNAKVDVAIPGVQMSGLQGIREPSGTIKLFDKVREITREDGTKLRSGFFVSNKSAEKFLAKAKERGEKIAERPAEEDITIDSSFLFTMAFCETPETRRVVAKIALAAVAHEIGVGYAQSAQFDGLRHFCIDTSLPSSPVSYFSNKALVGALGCSVYQHSVIAYFSARQMKAWAVVTLFGGLTFAVQLTENYQESSNRQFSIFYDAVSRKRFTPTLLANEMALVRLALSDESSFEDKKLLDEQWAPLIQAYCAERGIEFGLIPPS